MVKRQPRAVSAATKKGQHMKRSATMTPATSIRALAAAGVVAVVLVASGCGVSAGGLEAAQTPSASPTSAATASAISSESPAVSAETPTPTATASQSPVPEAVAPQWKTFTDPAKTVTFEVPQDWIVQLLPAPGPDAVQLEIKNPAGKVMATLNTHIMGLGGACQPATSRPYTVLASIPMIIPSDATDAAAVAPRYVYRVIQGANNFYASYGITDHQAGPDGKACLVYNTVNSQKLGVYMFGDVLQFTSAPDGSPGLRAFTSIAEAQAHMLSSEYQNIQKMITSLRALG